MIYSEDGVTLAILFKTVYLRGPCISRVCISRSCSSGKREKQKLTTNRKEFRPHFSGIVFNPVTPPAAARLAHGNIVKSQDLFSKNVFWNSSSKNFQSWTSDHKTTTSLDYFTDLIVKVDKFSKNFSLSLTWFVKLRLLISYFFWQWDPWNSATFDKQNKSSTKDCGATIRVLTITNFLLPNCADAHTQHNKKFDWHKNDTIN